LGRAGGVGRDGGRDRGAGGRRPLGRAGAVRGPWFAPPLRLRRHDRPRAGRDAAARGRGPGGPRPDQHLPRGRSGCRGTGSRGVGVTGMNTAGALALGLPAVALRLLSVTLTRALRTYSRSRLEQLCARRGRPGRADEVAHHGERTERAAEVMAVLTGLGLAA